MGKRLSTMAMAACCALVLGAPPSGGQAGAPVAYVYPASGTVSASPTTEISFRNVAAQTLGEISVRGSRSGVHRGGLQAHPDGNGVSFLPDEPFSQGETVTVTTDLTIPRARNGDFSFRILRRPSSVRIGSGFDVDTVKASKTRAYRTRPDLRPALVTVSGAGAAVSAGFVVLGPKPRDYSKQAGPMIIDNAGRVVYFRPMPGRIQATDVRIQQYRGQRVLTWWQGTSSQGIGRGHFVILDENYKLVKRVQAANGFRGDLHEFLITPQNTALLISYPSVHADLSSIGGRRNGIVADNVVQEIDIDSGRVLFEWHSLGTVPISQAKVALPKNPLSPHDYFHANSVDIDSDGDILVSARNTSAVYKIDRATARVEWTLGGRASTFRLGPGVRFDWQHDFRPLPGGGYSIFDNAASPPTRKTSRAITVDLDLPGRRATLRRSLSHPRNLLAANQGGFQVLPNGNSMVGWGSQRYFTEYDRSGRLVWDARVAVGFDTYRAYRAPEWGGRPSRAPDVLGERRGSRMDVYASWNGAAGVASWEVLGGSSRTTLQPLKSAVRSGFETRIPISRRTRYVAVRALDAAGAEIGRSATETVRP